MNHQDTKKRLLFLLGVLVVSLVSAQQRLTVTVLDTAGAPITDLTAGSFIVLQDKTTPQVLKAEYKKDLVDAVLLMDTSAYAGAPGGRAAVERAAAAFINQLGEKEQMALVGYATSADLLQDFTSSKQLLMRALSGIRYGNDAALLDGVYAALDSAFQNSIGRRVLVIVSTGAEGYSKIKRSEIVDLAERRKVSIFGVSLSGRVDLLEKLGEETAGAGFGGREVRQMEALAKSLFTTFRGHYELTVAGELSGRVKVEVKNPKEKLLVTQRKE